MFAWFIATAQVSSDTIQAKGVTSVDTIPAKGLEVLSDTVKAKELGELEVSAVRRNVKPTTRGIKISMADNPLSEIGSAVDAIKQIPLINAESGSITVVGKGTPVIYINGRLMRDESELALLTSKDLESVEIITNPSSKYGPEVSSVLLIKTKKRNEGMYANVGGTLAAADVMSESAKGGIGYQMENGLNFFGDFSFDDSRFKQKREYREAISMDCAPMSILEESNSVLEKTNSVLEGSEPMLGRAMSMFGEPKGIKGKSFTNADAFNHTVQLMASGGLNYDFGKHSMGIKYTFTRTPSMRFKDKLLTQTNLNLSGESNLSSESQGNPSPVEEISTKSTIFSQSTRHYLNYYAYFVLPKSVNLRLDFDYMKNKSNSENNADEEQTEVKVKNINYTVADLYAGKIEVEKSWDRLSISGGGEYT